MRIVIVFLLLVTRAVIVSAQPTEAVPVVLGETYVAVCNKIQACARVEFSLGQIPIEHAPILEAALDGLCGGVYESVERLAHYPELEASALACGHSLLRLNCDTLVGDRDTEDCRALIGQAKSLGLTLN